MNPNLTGPLVVVSVTTIVSGCGMSGAQWDMARVCQENPGSGMCRQAQENVQKERQYARNQRALEEQQREYERRRQWERDYNASEKAAEDRRAREKAQIASIKEREAAIPNWQSTVERLKSSEQGAAGQELSQIAWMTGFWCERDASRDYRALPDGLPHEYWEVLESGAFRRRNLYGAFPTDQHIEPVRAKYFDVYSYTRKVDYVSFRIARYEKRSDDQVVLVDTWLGSSRLKFSSDAAIVDYLKRYSASWTVRRNSRVRQTYERCG